MAGLATERDIHSIPKLELHVHFGGNFSEAIAVELARRHGVAPTDLPLEGGRSWWLAGATVAGLIPTLLYYGGGWLQYGYRYFLDSVPFVMAMCGLAAVYRRGIGDGWKAAIVFGTVVMAVGVYWAYNL
jgi:hypothetical protein